jgi:hypothetical protein
MPSQITWAEKTGDRFRISERRKPLLLKGLLGWEAGIRTPIPWSREPFTAFSAILFVRFYAVSVATTSVGFVPFPCALVQCV